MVVVRPFFIPRRQPPELFEAVNEALDPVALPVDPPIKRAGPTLVRLAGNGDADAAPPQVRPNLPAAVALVPDHTLGPQLRPSPSRPLDGPLLHQALKRRRFMALARREHDRQRLPVTVGAEVDFGTEPALAPAARLGFWVPFFAPAACWWARMTVAST